LDADSKYAFLYPNVDCCPKAASHGKSKLRVEDLAEIRRL